MFWLVLKDTIFSITRGTPARVVITFLFKWYGSDDVEKGGGSWSLYAEPGEGVWGCKRLSRDGVITRRRLYFKFLILERDSGLLETIKTDVSSEAGRYRAREIYNYQ